MRLIIIAAGAALALSACTNNDGDADDNAMAVDNLTVDNLIVNDGSADGNMTMNGTMTMDGNMTMDANTMNAVEKDLTTNDADTNLANGY